MEAFLVTPSEVCIANASTSRLPAKWPSNVAAPIKSSIFSPNFFPPFLPWRRKRFISPMVVLAPSMRMNCISTAEPYISATSG